MIRESLALLLSMSLTIGCASKSSNEKAAIAQDSFNTPLSESSTMEDKTEQVDNSVARSGSRYIKSTKKACEIRGGTFIAHKDALPDDMVDCMLPARTRTLGGLFGGLDMLGGLFGAAIGGHHSQPILGSAYDYLYRAATEKPGYGLYTYLLMPFSSARSERILIELFKTTSFVEISGISNDRLNIIYLPTRPEKTASLIPLVSDGSAPPSDLFLADYYNHTLARKLLARVCDTPTQLLRKVCGTDLSRGPYLFTYPRPVSEATSLSPPYLFMDMSNVHERAFGEFLAAYKEQMKRPDFSDIERIDNLRLRILSIVLTAADWIDPIRGALADTVYMVEADGD